MQKWVVVVNPNAGQKRGEKDWRIISGMLRNHQFDFKEVFTEHKEHAISITLESIREGFRKFIIVGGDGTLNEVVNGIFMQEEISTLDFLVGMIPVGTGNDWCRMFNIPFKYKKAVNVLKKQHSQLQDVGKVSYHISGDKKIRYFINVTGMGYDAVVAAKTNKDKEKGRGGPVIYFKNLLTSLLFYKHSKTSIYLDSSDVPITNNTFSLNVGICKYNGGGMKQLPDAIADDGIFDITLIRKISKFTVLKEVKNLFDGSFVKHPKVDMYRAKVVKVESSPRVSLEADGESLGQSPLHFECLHQRLNVIINPKLDT